MLRHSSWIFVCVGVLAVAGCGNCGGGSEPSFPPPLISQIIPARGPAAGGTVLILKGEHFSPDGAVRFGGTAAASIQVTGTDTIMVVTPAGSAGEVDVEVENPQGGINTFTAGFTYSDPDDTTAEAPALTAVQPNQGPIDGRALVEIRGTQMQKGATVIIGGRLATDVTWVAPGLLTAVTPPGAEAGNVDVHVTNPDGQTATLDGGYAYSAPSGPAPKIVAMSPNQGSVSGGEDVAIAVTDAVAGSRVYMGGRPATAVALVGGELTAVSPAGERGLRDVAVVNPDGQTAIQPEAFNYFSDPPRINRVDPLEGPKEGGTDIVIVGRNFDQNTNILIDGVPVNSLTIVDAFSATATTPAGSNGGWVDVKVVNADALSDILRAGFYYIDENNPPLEGGGTDRVSLLRVSPSTGPQGGGTSITLLGSGFKSGASVSVGGAPATGVRVLGPTTISATTPPGSIGPATVEVTNPDGVSDTLDLGFTYYLAGAGANAPQISGVAPNTGPTAGGTRAFITGANLKAGLQVFFGDTPATSVAVTSETTVSATVPAADLPGAVNVTLVDTNGVSAQLTSGFVYYAMSEAERQANSPVITSLTPAGGPADTATSVAISGDRFQIGALVFFGTSTGGAIVVDNPQTIHVNTPDKGLGPVDVTVTNPDGLTVTKNGAYTYSPPAPDIVSITPDVGPEAGGLTTLIVGSGFVNGAEVYFGTTPSSDVLITDGTVIRAVVPPGLGTVNVQVQNPDGQQATYTDGFTYDPSWVETDPPVLSEILPAQGPTTGGSVVLLRGANFLDGATVYFGQVPGTRLTWISDTEASVMTPPGVEGTVHVSWVNPNGQTSVRAGGYKYVDPIRLGPQPTVTGVTPTSGPESAPTDVLVTGRSLSPGAFIFFGGVLAQNPVLLSSNIYNAQAQPHAPGVVPVSITHPDGMSHTLDDAFTYVAAPEVTGVLPVSGATSGGTVVTITGTGFQPGATVTFGGVAATGITVSSATIIEATTPQGAAGPTEVIVANPDGQWGSLVDGYTFIPPPEFDPSDALLPATGPTSGGSVITIKGTGFQNGATVTFDGNDAVVEFVDDQTLVVSTPSGNIGTADVVITNPDGQSVNLGGGYTYKDPASLGPAPSLSQVLPAKGPDSGDSRVQIAGGSFDDGAYVYFGMKPGTDTLYINAATLVTTTPAHTMGFVEVVVTNLDGQSVRLADGFEFVDASTLGPPPTITLAVPQTASRFGGTSVTLTGTDFQNGAIVYFGGYPATTTTTNGATEATAVAPAHDEGPVLVQITNPDGQTAFFPGTFEYIIPPPQLATVNPAGGPSTGGTTVKISGTDLHPDVVITFGGKLGVNCAWNTSSDVDCDTPVGSDGPVDVTATNPDGASSTLAAGFLYTDPPVVTAVTPSTGPETGGTAVTITGTGFRANPVVDIGGVAATGVTFISGNAIQAVTPPGVGPAAVEVTNTDGQVGALAGGFTYLPPVPPPSITGLSPNVGKTTGGTNVTIAGTGFQAGAKVYFGTNLSATVQVFSPTYINVVAPPGAAGVVDITVENLDGQSATVVAAFQYITQGQLPPLALDQLLPDRGPVGGGIEVTVLGRGFEVGAIVAIGGNACTNPAYIGPGAIVCTVPAGTAGPANVTVTNTDGTSVTLNGGFTYGDGGSFTVAWQPVPSESRGYKYSGARQPDRNAVFFDVDDDNDLDLFTSRNGDNQIYLNDGTGRLDIVQDMPLQTPGYGARSAWTIVDGPIDVNNDGSLDLVVRGWSYNASNGYQRGVFVFTNTGGSFTQVSWINDYTMLDGSMTLVDVDNDADPDLIWGKAKSTDKSEALFINDGTGVFTEKAGAIPAVNDTTRAICHGDVDADGDQDIFLANDLDQQKRLLLNNGTGDFTDVSATHLNALGGNSQGCLIEDIDGDLDLDIILVNGAFSGYQAQQDRVFVNDGTGHFTDGTTGRFPLSTEDTEAIESLDIDFYGDRDLVARVKVPLAGTNRYEIIERVYLSDGNGQYVLANPDITPPTIGPINWYRMSEPGQTTERPLRTGGVYSWVFGDVDNDGYPDMYRIHEANRSGLGGNDGGQNRMLMNVPSPSGGGLRTFEDATMNSFPSEHEMHRTAEFADVDQDGDLDIIAAVEVRAESITYAYPGWCRCYAGRVWGEMRIYLNDGAGNFVDFTSTRIPPGINVAAWQIAVADFDGKDGPDFAVGDRSYATLRPRLFINDGSGGFTEKSYPNFPKGTFYSAGIAAVDVDEDGRPDLVFPGIVVADSASNQVRYWRNTGDAVFVDMTSTVSPPAIRGNYTWVDNWAWDISTGDLSGDGHVDLFLTSPGGNRILEWDPLNLKYIDITGVKMPTQSSGQRSVMFDADVDGDLDVIVANCTSSTSDDRLYLNTGAGFLADNSLTSLPRAGCTRDFGVVDPNGDGYPDLIAARGEYSTRGQQNRLFINAGAAIFTDEWSGRISIDDDPSENVVVGDVDNDGRDDIFFSNDGQSRIYFGTP